jgi:hypothetical protein
VAEVAPAEAERVLAPPRLGSLRRHGDRLPLGRRTAMVRRGSERRR